MQRSTRVWGAALVLGVLSSLGVASAIIVVDTVTWCHVEGESETTIELDYGSEAYSAHVAHQDDYQGECESDQCASVDCSPLPQYCVYSGATYEGECQTSCGEIYCEYPQGEIVVTKYVCPEGEDIPYYNFNPSQEDGSLKYDPEEYGCELAEGYDFGYRYLGGLADGDGDGDGDISDYPLVPFGPSNSDGVASAMVDYGPYEIGELDGDDWSESLLWFSCGYSDLAYQTVRVLGDGDGDGDGDISYLFPHPAFRFIESEDTVYCVAINPAPYCGDGDVNQDTEECDDGNNTSGDGCDATCNKESKGGGSSTRRTPVDNGDGDGDIPTPQGDGDGDGDGDTPDELLDTGGEPERPSATEQLQGVTLADGQAPIILPAKLFDTGGDIKGHLWLLWIALLLVGVSSGAHIYLHKHGK